MTALGPLLALPRRRQRFFWVCLAVGFSALQVPMAIQIAQLRSRIVQLEADLEFQEYAPGQCSPSVGGGPTAPHATQGFVGFRHHAPPVLPPSGGKSV